MFLDRTILRDRPVAVIGDLGIANFVGNEQMQMVAGLDNPNAVGLTVAYSSPELLRKISLRRLITIEADKKSDVYAFAVIVQECMNRHKPWTVDFTNGSRLLQDKVMQAIEKGERPAWAPGIKEKYAASGLVEIVERCWHSTILIRPSFEDVAAQLFEMYQKNK